MKNPFKKYRVDYLFFGSFAVLIIAILAATALTGYGLSSKELAETTSVNQRNLLDELNNEIASRLLTIEQISLSTSRDNKLTSFLTDSDEFLRFKNFRDVQQSLSSLTYSIPLIQGIDLYMNNPLYGDSQSYIQFHPLKEAYSQRWFDAVRRSDSGWSDEYLIHAFQGDVPVLSFARSIVYNNRLLGYLVIHVKADTLKDMLGGRSADASRMMLDGFGRPLLKIGTVPTAAEWTRWKSEMTGSSGVFRIHEHSGDSGLLLVYSRIPDSDWTMVEITPWSQITKGSLRLAAAIAAIGAAAILLTLGVTLMLSRQFTKPIKKLVTAMNRYSLDGRNEELPLDYENEFGYLFSGYRKQNERIEELIHSLRIRHEQQRRAEIEALQANINPHFLYNTLDQLNWMAIKAGQSEMSRILELMGRMFRIGLSKGETFITIAEEIEQLTCYIEIQQLRGGPSIEYAIEAPEELMELYMPKMILQPFVENAVVHGFHLRERGRIEIRIAAADTRLRITVDDDGAGLRGGAGLTPRRKTGGYGIRNVKERIAAYFGGEYGVRIGPREGGGTSAEIVLPLLAEKPGTAAKEAGIG
ncbi:cache domain-containing sensor histidine kinase [Paenibacillus humicola]|uniref:cache domain-containing sensor histidine kinase n=1 Tax=Paenibacillus humicola TaxID=3110540 RepID=UPI00237B8650|nr:sensor histidine kinase [Paenibacillus humicola]